MDTQMTLCLLVFLFITQTEFYKNWKRKRERNRASV